MQMLLVLALSYGIIYNAVSSSGTHIPLGPGGRVPLCIRSVWKWRWQWQLLLLTGNLNFITVNPDTFMQWNTKYVIKIKLKRNRQYWPTYLPFCDCDQKSLAEGMCWVWVMWCQELLEQCADGGRNMCLHLSTCVSLHILSLWILAAVGSSLGLGISLGWGKV